MHIGRQRFPVILLVMVGLSWAAPQSSHALINPRFTPAHIARSVARIVVIDVAPPKDKRLNASVTEVLKGRELSPGDKVVFNSSNAEQGVLDDIQGVFQDSGTRSQIGVLLVGSSRRPGTETETDTGLLMVGSKWFSLKKENNAWLVEPDKRDMAAVWGGSGETLVHALRYALKSPQASFPVRSQLSWSGAQTIGEIKGPVHGILPLALGAGKQQALLVLSEAGDRVLAAPAGAAVRDVTAETGLSTASRAAAWADLDGDGRIALASWDGQKASLVRQTRDGKFAAARSQVPLAEATSLAIMRHALGQHALVAGTRQGPLLAAIASDGFAAPRALVAGLALNDLGDPGPCAAADFDGDGRVDLVQAFSRGLLWLAGEGNGTFKAPVVRRLELPSKPRVVLPADFDGDQLVDLFIGGEGSLALVVGEKKQPLVRIATSDSGELAYHGGMNEPVIGSGAICDINRDGRPGLYLFYADREPMGFFNRGFRCFGFGRELALPADQPVTESLRQGQVCGTVLNPSGEGVPRLAAVDNEGCLWMLSGKTAGSETGK